MSKVCCEVCARVSKKSLCESFWWSVCESLKTFQEWKVCGVQNFPFLESSSSVRKFARTPHVMRALACPPASLELGDWKYCQNFDPTWFSRFGGVLFINKALCGDNADIIHRLVCFAYIDCPTHDTAMSPSETLRRVNCRPTIACPLRLTLVHIWLKRTMHEEEHLWLWMAKIDRTIIRESDEDRWKIMNIFVPNLKSCDMVPNIFVVVNHS